MQCLMLDPQVLDVPYDLLQLLPPWRTKGKEQKNRLLSKGISFLFKLFRFRQSILHFNYIHTIPEHSKRVKLQLFLIIHPELLEEETGKQDSEVTALHAALSLYRIFFFFKLKYLT